MYKMHVCKICVYVCLCSIIVITHTHFCKVSPVCNAILQNKTSTFFVKLVPIFWFHLSSVARLNASGRIMGFPFPPMCR